MRRIVYLTPVLFLLLLGANLARAQTSPLPSPTPPLTSRAAPALSLTPTATPEPLELPGAPGEWWKAGAQLLRRVGPWAAGGLLLLAIPLYFLWRVGEQVAGEEAKSAATRIRQGARRVWNRLTRRLSPEERAIVKDVCAACERLELKGFVKENITIVSLESVYVPLTTRGRAGSGVLGEGISLLRAAEGAGEAPLTDLIARHPRLALVGEAGSGKTTFVKYVALAAAHAYAGRGSDKWLPVPHPLPFCLPLHGFGRYLADQKAADLESPSPDLLRDYIVHHLRHLDLPEGWIAERLKAGNCLLLLDGLDEVARFQDRRFIAELVTRFAAHYDRCRIVVTTRPQGYEGAAQLGGDFERRDISPLAWPEDIRVFLYRWNEEIARRVEQGNLSSQGQRRARENADKLLARLETAANVRELADNPLLLTVMAIVHYNVGALPERRAELYDAATELFLGWDKRMGREALAPPPWLDELSAVGRRGYLEELAYDWQERRVLEQPRQQALDLLAGRFLTGRGPKAEETARVRADDYLKWVADRACVLQEIGGAVRFYRKPFQEYLAARRLARQPDLRKRFTAILSDDWRDRWWDETLLLTVGHLITADRQKANDLLTLARRLPDLPEAPHYNDAFVARALADVPEVLLGKVWQIREDVVERLAQAVGIEERAFTPRARLEAGLALGTLGDPRRGVGVDAQTGLPDVLWVAVPDDPFLMGSTDQEVEDWKEWVRQRVADGTYKIKGRTEQQVLEILWAWLEAERGQHSLQAPAFLISRYPVTNAQYGCFVQAGGYDDPAWWGGEGSPA
jgi:hypothetical protein